ncbi:MAG: relaxase/mobilization nuclease domain-containing protein [Clostridiaceae bacterium]|nr:relaxase/mobilization nuclease domain-containing protein [Clostridiaceae bacterium]
MATTRLIPMHAIKGQSIDQTVHGRIRYAINPKKTNDGSLVKSFGCDPKTAVSEMLLCKRDYATFSGRSDEKKSDVVLYQIRQSFKPGEVTAEQALDIGMELARRFTKDKFQYVVATHTDHAHTHNHIIFNSTAIDGTKKFRNFYGSSQAIRKLSDLICIENSLSVITNPSDKHQDYGKWLGSKKPETYRDKLRKTINGIMTKKPTDFDQFLWK